MVLEEKFDVISVDSGPQRGCVRVCVCVCVCVCVREGHSTWEEGHFNISFL